MKLISLCLVGLMVVFVFAARGPSVSAASASPGSGPATCAAPVADDALASGGACGGNICGKGQHCCNASCGWCVPIGVECIQIACQAGVPDPDEIAF